MKSACTDLDRRSESNQDKSYSGFGQPTYSLLIESQPSGNQTGQWNKGNTSPFSPMNFQSWISWYFQLPCLRYWTIEDLPCVVAVPLHGSCTKAPSQTALGGGGFHHGQRFPKGTLDARFGGATLALKKTRKNSTFPFFPNGLPLISFQTWTVFFLRFEFLPMDTVRV